MQSPNYELLQASHSLHQQSLSGRTLANPDRLGEHRDGTGVAWFEDTSLRIEKRGKKDCWDQSFQSLVSQINSTMFIAHNRKASPRLAINLASSHPFEMRAKSGAAAFCHNGGVGSLMAQAERLKLSESKFFADFLATRIDQFSKDAVAEIVSICASRWEYKSINALMLTSHALFAWRCFNDRHERKHDFGRYYTLYIKPTTEGITVASEPVDGDHGWQEVSNKRMLVARRGESELELEFVDL
ncbi:MAG: class II glutamine amidotransferase [Pseudomonadota bacterium]